MSLYNSLSREKCSNSVPSSSVNECSMKFLVPPLMVGITREILSLDRDLSHKFKIFKRTST